MRLLVSVMDPAEVAAAVGGGADIVDVKDPRSGPLGAPAPDVVCAVREAVGSSCLTSVALGETTRPPRALLAEARLAAAIGTDFVKLVLADGRRPSTALLLRVVEAVREAGVETLVVAVAYADVEATQRGWPLELPALAADAGARAAMLDTAHKNGTCLLDHLQESSLGLFIERARRVGLQVGLAGSLGAAEIRRLLPLAPDVVGVRGAACRGGRVGRVDAGRVRRLAHLVRRQRTPSGTTISISIPSGRALAR